MSESVTEICQVESDNSATNSPESGNPLRRPVENRNCTDVPFAILLLCGICLTISITIISVIRSDVNASRPRPLGGDYCSGDRPYLFFFDLTVCARMGVAAFQLGCPTPQVCVRECPKYAWFIGEHSYEERGGLFDVGIRLKMNKKLRHQMICLDGIRLFDKGSKPIDLVQNGSCAPYILPSVSVLGRCLPTIFQFTHRSEKTDLVLAQTFKYFNNVSEDKNFTTAVNSKGFKALTDGLKQISSVLKTYSTLQSLFQDIGSSWQFLLIGFLGIFLAVIVCLLWILLLRLVAKAVVIASIIGFVILFGVMAGLTLAKYLRVRTAINEEEEAKENPGEFIVEKVTNLKIYFDHSTELSTTWLVLSIVSCSVLVIVVVLLIWLRQRIWIAIALIEETSKSVSHMMSSLVFPIVPFVLQLALMVYFVWLAMHINTMGKAEMRNVTKEELDALDFRNMSQLDASNRVNELLMKWTPCDHENNEQLQVGNSTSTDASLCISVRANRSDFIDTTAVKVFIFFMFFWLFNFIDALCQTTLAGAFTTNKLNNMETWPLMTSLRRCLRYHVGSIAFGSLVLPFIRPVSVLFELLSSQLECQHPFNRNAYVMISIYGKNFRRGGLDSQSLIMRNKDQSIIINTVTDFVLFISKIFIVGIMISISMLIIDYPSEPNSFTELMTNRSVKLFLTVYMIYSCVCLFATVPETAVNTMLICYLDDLERNQTSILQQEQQDEQQQQEQQQQEQQDEQQQQQQDKAQKPHESLAEILNPQNTKQYGLIQTCLK